MAEIQVGAAITSGFDVIRRTPVAVLLWGLLQLAFAALTVTLFAPTYIALIRGMAAGGAAAAAQPNSLALAQAMQMQGISLAVNLGGLAVNAVLYCAVFRAVLHPEQSRYGYLRVGAAEMYTGVLIVGAYFALFIGLLLVMIPVGIIVGLLLAARVAAGAVIVGVVAGIAVIVGLIYAALRFSLVVPMMVDDGQFHLMESWELTKGKAGSLFIIGLAVFVLLLVAEVVIVGVLFAIGAGAVAAAAGGADKIAGLFSQPPGAIASRLAPFLVLLAVIWAPLAGCALAIMGAPWAKAYRDLVQADVSKTFA